MLRHYVTLLLFVISVYFTKAANECRFPEYALVDGSKTGVRNDWRTHIKNQNFGKKESFMVAVVFNRNVMRTTIVSGKGVRNSLKTYTRRCEQMFENDKFLVTHKEKGSTVKYACMQFLNRSQDVIQLKVTDYSTRRDINLCNDDNLKLDPWPLINRANMFQDHTDCPLKGGFQMRLLGMDAGKTCSAYDSHMRIESECMKGDGMVFYFREKQCIPEGLKMSIRQRVFCTASWTDGDYTFMVIQHPKRNHQWCLRYYSAAKGRPFTMYLFKDLVCDFGKIRSTDNFLRLEMKQETPQRSLCVDDFQGCAFWRNPCQHTTFTELTCAKKCSICNDTRPGSCTFPHTLWDSWVRPGIENRDYLKVSGKRLTIEGFSDFVCTEWDSLGDTNDMVAIQRMMVTRFENGCRPRYTCVDLKRKNPSVLHYRISQSEVWPFLRVDNKEHKWDCSSFKFHDDPAPLRDKYRSKYYKTLITKFTRQHVNCHFKSEKEFSVVYNDDGRRCTGKLTATEVSHKIKLIEKCDGKVKTETEFGCLDSEGHGYIGDHMIITEPIDRPAKIRCLLFPSTSQSKFYLMQDAECNENTKHQIEHKMVIPLAEFTVKRRDVITVHQQPDNNRTGQEETDVQIKTSRSSPPEKEIAPISPEDTENEEIQGHVVKGTNKSDKPEVASSLASNNAESFMKATVFTYTVLATISAYFIYVHTTINMVIP